MKTQLKKLLGAAVLVAAAPFAAAEGPMEGEQAPALPGVDAIGQQPVLVDFWASWCGPCQESFPWMNKMTEKYPELKIVAINLDEYREDADTFLDDNSAGFKILFDPEGKLAEKYKVDGMPSSYLVDASGTIVEQHVGFFAEKLEEYEASIQKLVEAKSASR